MILNWKKKLFESSFNCTPKSKNSNNGIDIFMEFIMFIDYKDLYIPYINIKFSVITLTFYICINDSIIKCCINDSIIKCNFK